MSSGVKWHSGSAGYTFSGTFTRKRRMYAYIDFYDILQVEYKLLACLLLKLSNLYF